MARKEVPVTRSVIAWARKRAGFKIAELEKDFPKLAEWENDAGASLPTYPQVERLADKFKVPVAVFFFPEPPNVPSVEETFRTLGPDEVASIPPRIRLLLRKARSYQLGLSELHNGRNPSERMITQELNFTANSSLDRMASRVREFLGVTLEEQFRWSSTDIAMKNWREALSSVGVYVFKDQFRQAEFSGFCLYDREFPIIYVNNSTPKSRQSFTMFHELAHLLFKTSGIDTLEDDYIKRLPENDRKIEIICNRFAGRFLVPEDAFVEVSKGKPTDEVTAAELAGLFSVSREVIFRKFLDREWISRERYEVAAKKWAREAQSGTGSGGNPYRSWIAYLGRDYISLAFQRYYQNRISEAQLSEYLDVKPKNLATLEQYLIGSIA